MNILLITVLSVWLAADPPAKGPESKADPKGKDPAADSRDPIREEYEKLLEKDEEAIKQVEKIFKEAEKFAAQGVPTPKEVIAAQIESLLGSVEQDYLAFLERNPKHVDALLAFGSFLSEFGDEEKAIQYWEKARKIDPKNPASWNNLANVYGHIGPVRKAFHYYEKAIELNPEEPVYLQNLATTTYLFRKDAMKMYRITEDQVFDKALGLYRRALALDPENFLLATDLAQSYYGIKPQRTEDAIAAWNDALKLAKNDLEKQGVYIHLARVLVNAGRFEDASKNLDLVDHPELQDLKARIKRNIERKQNPNLEFEEDFNAFPKKAELPSASLLKK